MSQGKFLLSFLLVILVLAGFVSADARGDGVKIRAELFNLDEIKLIGGPIYEQQEMNREYLHRLEPDRLLSWFRKEAGLDPKAPPYLGWESEGRPLPGHILGFYMSGASMMVQATGDEILKDRLAYIVDELDDVQRANGNGYMLAIKDGKSAFREIVSGKIEIVGLPWTGHMINAHFEPTYTLNKLMLGLYEIYKATGNEKAKRVLIKAADWFGEDVLDKLNEEQIQVVLDCEHGSLHESFADVYVLTGEKKYLDWARSLCHERMMVPLAKNDTDFLTHYHANCQIPKYTGYERVYMLTGEKELDDSAVNFWNEVVHNRSWVIGGNSANEHFFAADEFKRALSALAGPESCNSVNMLRLTESLYQVHPSVEQIDFYERVLYNHILPAHDNERGMFVYYTPMQPGSYRVYSDEFNSMWCCVGTGLEVPGKYGQMVYTHSPDNMILDVNMFVASELSWRERGIKIVQDTAFPSESMSRLRVECDESKRFVMRIPHPWWIPSRELKVSVNGKLVSSGSSPGGYANINREWDNGDLVEIDFPMELSVHSLPGSDEYVAIMYGPIVLSGKLGRGNLSKEDFWEIRTTVGPKRMSESKTPTFVCSSIEEVLGKIEVVDEKELKFRASGFRGGETVELIPFYDNHFEMYAVYFRCMTEKKVAEENRRLEAARMERAKVDAVTIDRVTIGNEVSEKKHNLRGLRTEFGSSAYGQDVDLCWRDARSGGWFSFDMKVESGKTGLLRCTYWGEESGARTFDIMVEGEKIFERSLGSTGNADFVHDYVEIPAGLIEGKDKVTVRFQAHDGNSAGGLFDLRVMKQKL